MTDPVHTQYEALPYPPRDPRDETKRLVTGTPSRLVEINHYIFGGTRDLRKPFRALIAGAGTGDAAIMLALHLKDAGIGNAEVVYLDWSSAARQIAETRARIRNLTNLTFVTGSLIEFEALKLGRFDYIDCCGVLHHLPDPPATLAALTSALTEDGGMGLMLYGRLGRTGIYPVQDMLRALRNPGDDIPARLATAKRLLAQLPPTNWLKRNTLITDHKIGDDGSLYDLLLHERDRAYDVPEIDQFVGSAGLKIVAFLPSVRYEPSSYLSDGALMQRCRDMTLIQRAAFAENLAGNLKMHVFYVVRASNQTSPPTPDMPDAIPLYCEPHMADVPRKHPPGSMMNATIDEFAFRLPLPSLTPAIAKLIDGQRSLGDIHREIAVLRPEIDWNEFVVQFRMYYTAFNGVGHLLLRRPV